MPWYVFALVERAPASRPGRGLSGALSARRVPGGYAIVERRADVPPLEFDALRAHDAVVTRIAAASSAILPVRYGTLLELDDIAEALAGREEEIADAFDAVRGRVQFTWRVRGTPRARGGRGAGGASVSGTAYLRSVAAKGVAPAAFRAVRDRLRPLVAGERYQPVTPSLPASLYHLVDRDSVKRYGLIAKKLASSAPTLRATGPFPPFAFTPELL
jgi:hypothetical protein